MGLRSIINSGSVFQHGGVSNPAKEAQRQGATVFSSTAKGAEAVINGIQAASLKANAQVRDLNASFLRGILSQEPSITNALRAATFDPDAARFDLNTSQKVRFRLEVGDIRAKNEFSDFDVKRSSPIRVVPSDISNRVSLT